MLRDVVGYRLLELSRGAQPLELQQRYFKDLWVIGHYVLLEG